MKVFAKILRIITVAPVMALIALCAMFALSPGVFSSALNFALSIVFLVAFPLLAYPVHALVPKLREGGRDSQRRFAIVMSVAGYALGFIFSIIARVPSGTFMIYFSYMVSAVLIAVLSKLGLKASGHVCGVVGPVILCAYYISPWSFLALLFLIPVAWSSLKIKRHTVLQLIVGGLVPIAAFAAGIGVTGLVY